MYGECPKRDVKLIIEDLSEKIGREEFYRHITGKCNLPIFSNDNGTRLINFLCSKT